MTNTNKIKTHFQQNKKVYIVAGVGVAGAVAAGYVGYRLGSLQAIDNVVKPKIIQILSYKPKATLEVYIEALGDPGDIIQDTKSGIIYASQGQAARELGLQQSAISRHLAGQSNSVGGHVFEKLGKAMVDAAS